MSDKTDMREGFEAQRKAGMNVDWFTWQIAWHDAMFLRDCDGEAPHPPTGDAAGKDSVDAARYRWLAERYTGFDFDWMPDNDGTGGKSVLCFQIDANFPVGIGRDVSVYIDAAIASLTKTADGEKDANQA